MFPLKLHVIRRVINRENILILRVRRYSVSIKCEEIRKTKCYHPYLKSRHPHLVKGIESNNFKVVYRNEKKTQTNRNSLLFACCAFKRFIQVNRDFKRTKGHHAYISVLCNSKRKAMNRIWSNQKANPALKTKAGNK